mgnify:CR=1 FL=1|jgi:alkylhydroperoxidase family enzyme|tara:strand:- start:619 stop:1098 length:480 start_codon:yes stop_codon:yes gene_type:complete
MFFLYQYAYSLDMGHSTSQFFDEVLTYRSGVKKELANIHDLAWDVVDKELLSLCKLRVAMILGCDEEVASAKQYLNPSKADAIAQWSSSNIFTEVEKSCLRFTEEFIIDVSSIPDASAVAVREHLDEDGFVTFVNALLVVEQRIRLLLVWSKLVGNRGT